MALPTITVTPGTGQTINVPNSGRRAAVDSQAVVLSNEDLAALATTKILDNAGAAIVWSDPAGRPAGAQQFADSAVVTNGTAITLTITPPTGKRVYVEGLVVRWMGATAKADNTASMSNIDNLGSAKTLNFNMYVPSPITAAGAHISERFITPLQAYAIDAIVVLSIPAPTTGNANLSASIWGFCA